MASNDRLLELDDVVDTSVGVEVGLDLVEDDDGAVSASTAVQSISVSSPSRSETE